MMEDAISIFKGDEENKEVLLEGLVSQRGYEDREGNKKLLENRNTSIINRYIKGQ